MSQKKLGPIGFDVYWIQTNRQTSQIYIYIMVVLDVLEMGQVLVLELMSAA